MTKIVNCNVPGGSHGYAGPVSGGRGSGRKAIAAALMIGAMAAMFTACPTDVEPSPKPSTPTEKPTTPTDKGKTEHTITLTGGKEIVITINNNNGSVTVKWPDSETAETYTGITGSMTDGFTITGADGGEITIAINGNQVTVGGSDHIGDYTIQTIPYGTYYVGTEENRVTITYNAEGVTIEFPSASGISNLTLTDAIMDSDSSGGYTITDNDGDVTTVTADENNAVIVEDPEGNKIYDSEQTGPVIDDHTDIVVDGVTIVTTTTDGIKSDVKIYYPENGVIECGADATVSIGENSWTIIHDGQTTEITRDEDNRVIIKTGNEKVYDSNPKIIPAYTTHSKSVVSDIGIGNAGIGAYGLISNIALYGGDTGKQSAVRNKYFDFLEKMLVQSDNLKNGYAAVGVAYPCLPGLESLANGEAGIYDAIDGTQVVATFLSNAAANMDTMLNGIITCQDGGAEFSKNLAAYRKGFFYEQKLRVGRDTAGIATAKGEFQNALSQAGQTYNGSSIDSADNVSYYLENTLRPDLLDHINEYMMGDSNENIESAGQVNTISGLNNDLISQIQDTEQLRGAVDDLTKLNYTTTLGMQVGTTTKYSKDTNEETTQPVALQSKAGHFLENGFNYGIKNQWEQKNGISMA